MSSRVLLEKHTFFSASAQILRILGTHVFFTVLKILFLSRAREIPFVLSA